MHRPGALVGGQPRQRILTERRDRHALILTQDAATGSPEPDSAHVRPPLRNLASYAATRPSFELDVRQSRGDSDYWVPISGAGQSVLTSHCATTRFNVVPAPNDADGAVTPLMSESCSTGMTDG